MIDVLLAWELGSGLGHFNRLFQLGDALVGQGQRVAYALVQQPPLDDGTAAVPREVIQAPFLKNPERLPPFAICNYGELLLSCGYRRPVELQALFHGWCAIRNGAASCINSMGRSGRSRRMVNPPKNGQNSPTSITP